MRTMLDMKSLLEVYSEGKKLDYLFFWGHQPSKDGKVNKSCFSQWYDSVFSVDGIRYRTAEHWMMAEKARLFGDEEHLAKILVAETPKEAKALGRKVKGFVEKIWKEHRFDIVVRGNREKFEQDEELKSFLLGTGEQILVEASPYDRIWGIGMKENDPRAFRPEQWDGQNLLGFALMQVRQEFFS